MQTNLSVSIAVGRKRKRGRHFDKLNESSSSESISRIHIDDFSNNRSVSCQTEDIFSNDRNVSTQTEEFRICGSSALPKISRESSSFEVNPSNGCNTFQLGPGLVIASMMIDDNVAFTRARSTWLKSISASFAVLEPGEIGNLVRAETAMSTVILQLVAVIKHQMVAKTKEECNGILSISMDESNKKGDDKMMIALSYATDTGRVKYNCVGAPSIVSKKAEESYEHTVQKCLNEFDPSGEISEMLATSGTGMVDHAPGAMKLVKLTAHRSYECDAHGLDLVYATMCSIVAGEQDDMGLLRLFQFLFELGYTSRHDRKIWTHVMERAYGSYENAPAIVRKLIRLINSARWGSAGIVANEYLELAELQAPPKLIDYGCETIPGATPETLAEMKTVSGSYH